MDRSVAMQPAGNLALAGAMRSAEVDVNRLEIVAFDQLRVDTYGQMKQEISDRLALNPTPTDDERLLGTYTEALEPQVREATMAMRSKGYNTIASGFHGTDDNWRVLGIDNPARDYDPSYRRGQIMDFREPFTLSSETRLALKAIGAEIPEYPGLQDQIVRIGFTPTSPDIDTIGTQWNAIADLLPDTGIPSSPRMETLEAHGFGVYCPPDVSWPVEDFNAIAANAASAVAPASSMGGETSPGQPIS